MKINRQSDIAINVLLPLTAGYRIYAADFFSGISPFIRNYFPDGLWAYAFLSAILIVWKRQINVLWVTILFLVSATFEVLQVAGLVTGTGDVIDLVFYSTFFCLALLTNNYFKKLTYHSC